MNESSNKICFKPFPKNILRNITFDTKNHAYFNLFEKNSVLILETQCFKVKIPLTGIFCIPVMSLKSNSISLGQWHLLHTCQLDYRRLPFSYYLTSFISLDCITFAWERKPMKTRLAGINKVSISLDQSQSKQGR